MVTALIRFAIIILAYGLASLAAGYAVYIALLIAPADGLGKDAYQSGITFGLVIAMFVAMFAALPASAVVAVGEFRSWRMWWYYAIAGAVIGAVLGNMFMPPLWFPWLGLGFGPVSGLIYWGIAGRNAGLVDRNPRLAVALAFSVFAFLSLIFGWSIYAGAIF